MPDSQPTSTENQNNSEFKHRNKFSTKSTMDFHHTIMHFTMNHFCKSLRKYTRDTEFELEEEYTVEDGGSGQEAMARSNAFQTRK